MKKILAVFLLLVAVALGVLVFGGRSGGLVPTGSASDRRHLEEQALKFLEDLKFKDFQKAASYHSLEDRKKADIGKMIENHFHIKPETLDIMRYEVIRVDVDSSGLRGRVKTRTVAKVLNTNQIIEPEMILYWFKDPTEGWVMELESSL